LHCNGLVIACVDDHLMTLNRCFDPSFIENILKLLDKRNDAVSSIVEQDSREGKSWFHQTMIRSFRVRKNAQRSNGCVFFLSPSQILDKMRELLLRNGKMKVELPDADSSPGVACDGESKLRDCCMRRREQTEGL
jgi:hypothetical protein